MGCCGETDKGLAGHKSMVHANEEKTEQAKTSVWYGSTLGCGVVELGQPENEAGGPTTQICQRGEIRDASWERGSYKL